MEFLVLSTSLDPLSRSRMLAGLMTAEIGRRGHAATMIDLRDHPLPRFDNAAALDDPTTAELHSAIASADGIVLAAPVYNWALGSAAKHLIELTGVTAGERRSAWFDKLVTFISAGGLPQSYTAFGPLALGLMLDFKCVINPYTIYAADGDWAAESPSAALVERISRTADVKLRLADAVAQARIRSEWDV